MATATEAILKALKERKIAISKVTGFGSDGASAISSNKEGVVGKFKRLNPNVLSVHCIAHKLQLSVSPAAEKVKFLTEFQEMLTSMFYHFKKSALRTEKRSFAYRGASFWNRLPKDLKEVVNSDTFKKRIVNMLLT